MHRNTILAALFILWPATAAVTAQDQSAIVAGGSNDGRLLLGELNCVACHAAPDSADVIAKKSPLLREAGRRVTPQYLRHLLSGPQHAKPGTPMPDLLHHLDDAQRAETVDLLVHYLASLGGTIDQRASGASDFQIQRGQELFHRVGCVACHEPVEPPPALDENAAAAAARAAEEAEDRGENESSQAAARPSVPLGKLAMKTTVEQLAEFLLDPLKARPAGRMPSLSLTAGEANMIAAYLLREQASKTETGYGVGLDYAYYEGNWKDVPDFDKLKPKAKGGAKGFDVAAIRLDKGKPKNNFAVRFRGLINVPDDGSYLFATKSDDGSVLRIDGKLVVDNDGTHGPQEREGTVELKQGRHTIEVGFAQGGGGFELAVTWRPPGAKGKQPIPPGLLLHSTQAMIPQGVVEFRVDPGKAAQGRKAFYALGCVNCHEMNGPSSGEELVVKKAPSLDKLDPSDPTGCLGDRAAAGRPKFALDQQQRSALKETIASWKTSAPRPLETPARVAHSLTALGCYACHARGDLGGPAPRRAAYFTTQTEVDLGEEGRLPPPLDGVGAKLSPAGFDAYLNGGLRARTHMTTRMPQFGKQNVAEIPKLLAAADAGTIPAHKPQFSSRMIDDGRRLVGKQGLGCINCHAWGNYKLQGADGLDLLKMPARLDASWFHKFMSNPQVLKPRTRMPTGWPDGNTFFPDMQGGDVDKQIDAVWAYLSAGERGGLPRGLSTGDEYLLTPTEEPIVFRTFVSGIGAHAIAVGFRQRTHVAFDALRVRMALTWTGDFLSAQPAWSGRAGQYARPPEANLITFPPGSPLAILESPADAWPALDRSVKAAPAGWKFAGYRFDNERVPTFLYRFGEIEIGETPSTSYHQTSSLLVRKFQLAAPGNVDNVYLRVAAGKQIAAEQDGSFTVDGKQRYRINSAPATRPIVRRSEGAEELLVPVEFAESTDQSKANIEVQLTW